MHLRLAWRSLRSRLWLRPVPRKSAAGLTAAALVAGLLVAVAVIRPGGGAASPAQRLWVSAAARAHRVPASATMVRLINGRVVPALAGWRPAVGAAFVPPGGRGAVPAARPPRPLRFPVAGKPRGGLYRLPRPKPAAKKGFDRATSRVLPKGTSADTVIYQNADGTRTAYAYQWPVNWRRPDGSWARIDTSLVPAGGATGGPSPSAAPSSVSASPVSPRFTPLPSAPAPPPERQPAIAGFVQRSSAQPVWFAAYADAGTLVRLPLDGSHAVGFALAGAAHTAAAVQENSVTYTGARADSDVQFTGGTGFVKERLTLRSADAPAVWVFPLRLAGLRARAAGGVIEFTDAAGKLRAFVPRGFMTDSNIGPHSGDGAYSAGVTYSLTSVNGRPAVRMTLDEAWLRARGRVFPVTVDPSVSSFNSGGTTYVLSSAASSNFSTDTEIKIGTWDEGSDKAESFMKFGSVSTSLANDNVLGVRLGVFNSWSYSCSPRTVWVDPITQSWSVSGTTWPGPSTGASIAHKSFATGWVPYGSTVSPCPSRWEAFNLGEAGNDLVNGWTHGTIVNNGLALHASASDSYGWKKFTSYNATHGDPFLAVTYTPYGARYKLASSKPVVQITPSQNGKLAIKVTNTGADTWTPTNGFELSYRAYNSKGQKVADHPVFTAMPSDVAPGASVRVDANVNALPAGDYAIDFDMYANATGTSPTSFSSQGVAPFAVGLHVAQPPPVVNSVYPPTGYLSPTVTPQLSTSAFSSTGGTITYDFSITCNPLPGQTCAASAISSGQLSEPYWTPPPLTWNVPYSWTVTATVNGSPTTVGPVSITPQVPQPDTTSGLGNGNGDAFDPQTGNYTTTATEAAVAVAGPPLQIDRVYNSLDPRTSGAFGAGWSAVADIALAADNDGSGNVVVTMPDGGQERFGCSLISGTCSYTAPVGSNDVLAHNSDGTWSMLTGGGTRYDFTSGGTISKITDPSGLAQTFTLNTAGEVTTIADVASARALHVTWATPSGAAHPHVASVTTDPPASGQSGLSWTYTYSGDQLTKVCAPSGGCTTYAYATTGSQYWAAVQNDSPRSYWQLGDASGSATAADDVGANLGTADGGYSGVTLGAAGPLAASSETAASFNGTSSYVTLPSNVISDSTCVAAELWFKAATTTASGVLLSYQADAITSSTGNSDPHTPALYVGGDGKLYGEFWNGKIDPMSSPGSVADGKWHHVVLTGSGTSQSLWLDGTKIGSLSGQIDQGNMTHNLIGAGFWAGGWPGAYINSGPALVATAVGYFNGSIAQAAVYPHPLGQPAITAHYALATRGSPELTQVSLPTGTVFQQASYDPDTDRLDTYTDSHGGQWQIHSPLVSGYKATADSLGEVTRSVTVADPAGRDEVYSYDTLNGGRIVSYNRGAGNAPRTFGYDSAGFLNSFTDEDGNLLTFTNDIHGNVLTRTWYPTQPASITNSSTSGTQTTSSSSSDCTSSGAACTTYYGYYYNGANPLDPRNNKLTALRDARSASATDNTYLTSYAYNAAGQLTSATTPATSDFPSGRTTSYTYSTGSEAAYGGGNTPAGLLLSQTTPGNAVTSYSYYSNGDLAQVTESSGRRTVYTYDGLGRPATSTEYTSSFPSGLVTSYSYNTAGQPLTVTHPGVHDQVTGVVHTLADRYSYDGDGNLLQLTESDTTGADPSRTTSYTYNDHGEVATVTEPAGATTGSTAPPQGASSPYPAGATTAYNYDESGNVVSMVDADGNTHDYTYNEYNEVTQIALHTDSTDTASPSSTCSPPATQAPDGGCDLVVEWDAYDPAGLLASRTDAMGRITNYTYYFNQNLATVQAVDPVTNTGRMTTFHYDPADNPVSRTVSALSSGQVTASTVTDASYDAASRLTSQVIDPVPAGTSDSGYVNRTTSYTYNADNHVTSQSLTGALGSAQTSYGYDTAGDLTSQTVADGSANLVTTWTYDQRGLATSVTDPRGNATGATPANYTANFAYDEAGNLTSMTGPPVTTQSYGGSAATTRAVTQYGYDTFGDQTEAEDPNLDITAATYDGDGRVASVTMPSYTPPGSSTAIAATTTYGYDGLGNLVTVTDPAGNTTSYGYDGLGDLVSRTDPQLSGQAAPGVWTYTYDAAGEQLSVTDPTGAKSEATYDYFRDQETSTQDIRTGGGTQHNTTSYIYDYLGDPTRVTSPAGVVTKNTYDHVGELASSADSYGNTTSYGYDYAGRVAQITNPDLTFTTYGHDPAGNLTAVTAYGYVPPPQTPPVLRTVSFGYDPAGNLDSATDGNKHTTTLSYDAANHLTGQTQAVSSTSSITRGYGYDPAGNQTSVTDGRGNTTWTTYNAWNMPESVIEPATPAASTAASRTWTTSYDANGRMAAVSQPGGISLTDSYDQLGDLTGQSGAGAQAATPAQSFGYDLDGRMTSASAPGGTDTFTYNDASQLTATSGPSGTASFAYNPDGNMTSRTGAAGASSYAYDQAGRLATATDPLTGAALTYGYTPDSQVSSVAYAISGTAGPTRTLGYDQLHQITSDTLTSAGGATIASASYGYDGAGNLTSQTTTGFAGSAATSYGYDQANRLTSATTGGVTTAYGYDAAGDLTQVGGTTYSYNAQDQLTSSANSNGTTSYSYNSAGALASITPPSGSAQTFTSNAFGQTATATVGATTVGYGYDALGRLATRSTGTTTSLAYSGTGNVLASDGATTYSNDPSGGLIGVKTASGTAGAALTSPVHGDVTATFSPASTTSGLAASAAYSPYGAVTAKTGTMPALGYQGGYTDPVTAQVDMAARWYNPPTGGFTSNDTMAGSPMPVTLNPSPYGYAASNPLTTTDPTGHETEEISGGGGCCVSANGDYGSWTNYGSYNDDMWKWTERIARNDAVDGNAAWIWAGWAPPPWESPYRLYPIWGAGMRRAGFGPPGWYVPPGSRIPGAIPPGGDYQFYPGGPGGGYYVGPGGVGCGSYCIPLPPPPPPQDCYAGPSPSCHPPAAPRWMRHRPYIAHPVRDVRKPRQIHRRHWIIERPPVWHNPVKGMTEAPLDNGGQWPSTQDNSVLTQSGLDAVGEPVTPAAPSPVTSAEDVAGAVSFVPTKSMALIPAVAIPSPPMAAVPTTPGQVIQALSQADRLTSPPRLSKLATAPTVVSPFINTPMPNTLIYSTEILT